MSWNEESSRDGYGQYDWGNNEQSNEYYTSTMKHEYSTEPSTLQVSSLGLESLEKLSETAARFIRRTLSGTSDDDRPQEVEERKTSSHWYHDASGSRVPLRHLDDSDLALSQEIFIRRCQGQEKLDFRDLLTPEMRAEAQRLLYANSPNTRKYHGLDN